MKTGLRKNAITFLLLFPGAFLFCDFSYSQDNSDIDTETADDTDQVRFYRNPEERRETGFGTQLTDQLKVSGLLEIEKLYRDDRFINNQEINQDEARSHTLELGIEAEISENFSATLIFEAEYQNQLRTRTEEAVITYDFDDFGIELGYQDLPFGEYYSHFVTGPLLEFGETKATTLVIDYEITDHYDTFVYVFDGKTHQLNQDSDIGWGLGIEYNNENESLRLGAGYLSNLAESDERLLEDTNNIYSSKVPAFSAYALLGFNQFEATAEYVTAIKSFTEFEENENRPSSYNLELAWFINNSIQLAFRIENSKELAEQPERQYGIAATWRMNDNLSISAEYLRGDYKKDFVFNDDDLEFENHHQYGVQVSFEF